MPIETNNLVLYKSERLTDTSDGGGKYSGQVVIDGESNNLFPDVSELDRTMGRVSLRKIFPAINNNDTESLMGSTVFVSKNPDDPNVSALLFSTRSHTDTRDAAQNRVENYLAKGAQIAGTPLDTLWQGMKLVQVAMFPSDAESSVGDTIVLVSNEGLGSEYEQYVRITKVETRTAKMIVDGKEVEYKIGTYSINDPLERDFIGLSASQWYSGAKSTTIIRDTLVADTGNYYASVGVVDDVTVNSFTIQAESIFSQLIPSSQTETPLLDLNAVSENPALVAGNSGTITTHHPTNVNNNQSLYIGSSVMPSSVSFTLFGQAIADNGGTLRTASGTQVGTIDYQTGRIVWTNAIGSGNATLNITFTPASAPVQPFESYALPVTANNQGINWTGVLMPIPAPGALSISFMAQGKFYVLKDNGTGRLVGANESVGSGSINYQTGSWLLTTGALPDVGTPILLQWGSPITTFARANLSVSPAGVDFQTFHNGLASMTVTWLLNGETKTATANSAGQFTGDATGYVRFNDGKGRLIPNKLPQKNTVFTIAYDYGDGKTQTVNNVNPDASQKLTFTIGTGPAIQPGSVGLDIPVTHSNGATGIVSLHDTSVNATTGNLVDQFGNVQGSIIYETGVCEVTATMQKTIYTTVYTPFTFSHIGVNMSFYLPQISEQVPTLINLKSFSATTIQVKYRDTSGTGSSSTTVTADKLRFDLTQGFDEQILSSSVRFKLGADTFIDRTGLLYRNVDSATGSGTQSGIIQYGTGIVEFDSWTPNVDNQLTLQSLTTTTDMLPIHHVSFRTPTIPIRPGSLTIVVGKIGGGQLTLTASEAGIIETDEAHGSINYETGFVDIYFYKKTKKSDHPEIVNEDWYDPLLDYTDSGNTVWVNAPVWIDATSVRYNAIAYTYIPLDSEILGLSATRLPPDGRVPIFRVGDIGVIASSKLQQLPSHVAGQTYDLNDQRISWCELEDANGVKVPFDMYTVNYDYGKVTLSGDFALNALVSPISAAYRYQDMGLINDVQINGQITLTKPVTHNYDADSSIVGSALVVGDMFSRYTAKFVQGVWNSVWADTATGASITPNYNDALYPIEITNKGAIQERWAIVFTDATNFRITGEVSGQIGTGTVNTDCEPINPVTSEPYFVVKKEGWGTGWVSGNVLRFNTIASMYPIWCIRTVKQSEPTVLSDNFQIMYRGDIDRDI